MDRLPNAGIPKGFFDAPPKNRRRATRTSSGEATQSGPSASPDQVSPPGNRPPGAGLLERPYNGGREIAEVKDLSPELGRMLEQHLADRDDLNRYVDEHGQEPVRTSDPKAKLYFEKQNKAKSSGYDLGRAAEHTPLFKKLNTIVAKHTTNPPPHPGEGSA